MGRQHCDMSMSWKHSIITCELSNYLTWLETKAKDDMMRKMSESGRARRVELREERKEQTADEYRKDISAGTCTHQRPGAAIEWQEPRPDVNLDVDLTAEENEEEVDAGTSVSVKVESMMDDEEEVAQKNGESINDVAYYNT